MEKPQKINIAVVGLGYWGPNILRAFTKCSRCFVKYTCDLRKDRKAKSCEISPGSEFTTSYEKILSDEEIDAIAIVTNPKYHLQMALEALNSGKHVFVEKPMTMTVEEAKKLNLKVKSTGKTLMVGHLLEYHPGIDKIKRIISSGELGNIYYGYSTRVNLGKIRREENVLWSLAAHDISVFIYLFGGVPMSVSAFGMDYIQKGIHDVVFLNLLYPDKKIANIHISWLDPHKIRKITIAGDKKMVVFDDMNKSENVKIFDKGVSAPVYKDYRDYLSLRFGDITIPPINGTEPLMLECQQFIDCVLSGQKPRSDEDDGLNVVKILSSAQKSLESNGIRIEI